MNKRYLCSRHSEKTPSVVVYPDHGWCYGCCQKIPLNELGVTPQEALREASYIEDVAATIRYIESLPKKTIRGFSLPFSPRGYYIVFPCKTYYKLRLSDADTSSKYRGPTGHKKPPFILEEVTPAVTDRMVMIEGEMNAMSFAATETGIPCMSPGGAGDFYSSNGQKYLPGYAQFSRVDIVVDADAAGAQAAIETKAKLITLGCPEVRIHLMERDMNQIHCEQGLEAVREEAKRMGLLS